MYTLRLHEQIFLCNILLPCILTDVRENAFDIFVVRGGFSRHSCTNPALAFKDKAGFRHFCRENPISHSKQCHMHIFWHSYSMGSTRCWPRFSPYTVIAGSAIFRRSWNVQTTNNHSRGSRVKLYTSKNCDILIVSIDHISCYVITTFDLI